MQAKNSTMYRKQHKKPKTAQLPSAYNEFTRDLFEFKARISDTTAMCFLGEANNHRL
jgi:hypothetical protein